MTPFLTMLTGAAALGLCACATTPEPAPPAPTPVAPAAPVIPPPLVSEFRNGFVVQKLRVVFADAPVALDAPRTKEAQPLYAALASRSREVVFTEMVTVDMIETTGSFPLKPIKGENDNCRYEFKPRHLNNDKWRLDLSVTEKRNPQNGVQTSVIIESGTLFPLGGYRKTAPKTGKTTTRLVFIEVSPSFAELPGTGGGR